tara:strand:- start:27324 stop:28595 length:1272 start_codon:yes stop_codon:yes gene_type:complete
MIKYNFFQRQINNLKKEGHRYFIRISRIIFFFYLKKIFIIFLSILLLPFFSILITILRIKFIEIDASRMGHLATHFEPYVREIYFKDKLKNNYIVFFNSPYSNRYLFKLYKEFINSNNNIYNVYGYMFWKTIIYFYEKIFSNNIQKNLNVDDFYNDFHDKECLFTIKNKDKFRGEKLLDDLGIPQNSKFICVHNRDNLFLKKKFKHFDFSYHDYRDFSITDMIPALNYFTDCGYYVIRFGAVTQEKINTSNSKIIDYANLINKDKDGFGDIYFNSKCDFYFGSDSGAWNISRLFRRPGFIINSCPLASIFVMKWNYPSIFKRLKNIKTNNIVSIDDMVKNKLHLIDRTQDFQIKGFEVISNTKDDILEFAKEVISFTNRKDIFFIKNEKKLKEFHATLFKGQNMKKRNFKNPIGNKFLENTII